MDMFGLNYIGDEECLQGAAANQPGLQMNAEQADGNNNTVYLIDSSEIGLQNVQVAAEISVFDKTFQDDIFSIIGQSDNSFQLLDNHSHYQGNTVTVAPSSTHFMKHLLNNS